jgi:hypothetical protein
MGLEQNREVIRALICEKYDETKLLEEKQRKRQTEETEAIECLEKGDTSVPCNSISVTYLQARMDVPKFICGEASDF